MSNDRWASVSSDRLEAELVSWAAREATTKAMFLDALGEFIARRGWESWECASVIHWLSWKCGLGRVAASEHARAAVALRSLPDVLAAMREGRLSWSKVREVTRVASAEDQQRWIDLAVETSAAQLERVVRAFRRVHPLDAAAQHEGRRFSWRCDDDGSVLITVKLEAVQGSAVIEAVRGGAPPVKGVAFGAVCADRFVALALGEVEPTPVEVVIHVDAGVLGGEVGECATEQGVPVAVEVVEECLCERPVRVAEHRPDGTVELGPRRRFATAAQRRRLLARRRCCAFPGCHHEGRLHAHHVVHAVRGGPTIDANLELFCATHHRLIHLQHLQVVIGAGGDVTVLRSDGRPLERPIDTLTVSMPEPTATPTGSGERLDLDHTLTCLTYPHVVSRGKHEPHAAA